VKTKPALCVVLLSGGLDSAVTLSIALAEGFEPHALTVSYGQRHEIEIESARRICQARAIADHRVVEIDLRVFGGSALTDERPVPKGRSLDGPTEIPSTYVPARNTIFLSLALSFAEAIGARDIFTGVSAVDYSGYPDCRPAFIEGFERLANLGTRAADGGDRFRIHAPLIGLTKAATAQKGLELGVDFGLTWTCYDPLPDRRPCGGCDACRLRAKGFEEAGLADPLLSINGLGNKER
jgi:7-cyano-7-deazaguanine synthase